MKDINDFSLSAEAIIIVDKGIKSLKEFIKHADHSLESTFDLIFADELNEQELEVLFNLTSDFDTFQKLEESGVVTTDELEDLLTDLESLK